MSTKTKVQNVTLFESAADIDKAIAQIAKAGTAFDKAVQKAALSVMQHVAKHGDTTLADRLAKAMPKGSRLKSLAVYMTSLAPMRILDKSNPADADAIANGRVFAIDRQESKTFDLAVASVKLWTDAIKAETVESLLDLNKAVVSLNARIKKAIEAGKSENIDGAIVEARAMLKMLEAAKAA